MDLTISLAVVSGFWPFSITFCISRRRESSKLLIDASIIEAARPNAIGYSALAISLIRARFESAETLASLRPSAIFLARSTGLSLA